MLLVCVVFFVLCGLFLDHLVGLLDELEGLLDLLWAAFVVGGHGF
jgi:hypothetical protein